MDTCSVRGDTVSQTNVLSFARINVVYLPELGGQLPPLTPVPYAYVHLVWHMVRTPILPLSPGRPIFSLIRRNISSFWGKYFISLMYSCDVDIASTRRLALACRSLSHSTRGFKMWLDMQSRF